MGNEVVPLNLTLKFPLPVFRNTGAPERTVVPENSK